MSKQRQLPRIRVRLETGLGLDDAQKEEIRDLAGLSGTPLDQIKFIETSYSTSKDSFIFISKRSVQAGESLQELGRIADGRIQVDSGLRSEHTQDLYQAVRKLAQDPSDSQAMASLKAPVIPGPFRNPYNSTFLVFQIYAII